MNLGLDGKVVFVAGSSRGIGLATARAFLTEGAKVVLSARRSGPLTTASRDLSRDFGSDRVKAIAGDLSHPVGVRRAVRKILTAWGRIDCLIANIGSGSGRPGWDLEESEWETAFDMNLNVSVLLARSVLPVMLKRKSGSIILVSSIAGLEALPAPLPYSVAKTGLLSYCKNLSRHVARSGIRVNSVAPGNVLFAGGAWDKKLRASPRRTRRYVREQVPMSRFGTPSEVADAIVFLSSERASFITGACVVVDGGQTRSL